MNHGMSPERIATDSGRSTSAQALARSRLKLWAGAGVALVVLLAVMWRFTGDHGGGKVRAAPAAPVRTAQVVRRDMAVVEHTIGRVVSPTMVQVTARVQGMLDAAYFQEGQFVKKGDLLFQIDPRPFAAALDQARAMLERDEAQLKNANRDLERYSSLLKSGNASVQQVDTASANAQALIGTVASDKAAIAIAQLNLEYAQIRSPVDGKTGPLLIQPGNMIAAIGTTPLVTIAQLQPVKVSFPLPQTDIPRIEARQRGAGLKASLDIQDAGGKHLAAPVDFTDNSVNNQSGTLELRATFDNADFSLVPGQLVNVTVEMDDMSNALVVPREAVNDGPTGSYLYVVAGGKAEVHPVKVLFDDGKDIAVEGDVKPGDPVITEGQLRVLPNAPVNVMGASSDGTAAAEAAAALSNLR